MSSEIKFGKLKFKRNGVLASGIMGLTGWSMVKVARCGAGGITTKSISKNIREGHKTPIIQVYKAGLINAVGLSSTGVANSNKELKIIKNNSDAVIIASIFGSTPKEFAETAEMLDNESYDAIEANISCPNVESEFGQPFAASSESAAKVTKEVRKATKKPLIVKLSPNFNNIGEIAKKVESEGADGITAINSVGPGMLIDINTFQPKISNKIGGVTGPGIFPIAVRCVYDIYKSVKIPIIGVGGIISEEDAIQIILAGASLYSIGTGILYEGLEIFSKINNGIDNYLKEKKLNYKDLIGLAHSF
ncbi:MAG: dihydroorotate dehydrogenase [Spirochaetes bacterium]|nr:dihydroorotate dehydrogenase [Spirochaetota bacterium]